MEASPYIHFFHLFSWATRVSIELPVGFEEQQEDPDTNSAVYADDLDDEDEPGARVMTKMTAVPVESSDAYRSLAAASAQISSRSVEQQRECAIDGSPAVRQIPTYREDEAEIDVICHETVAQLGNVAFSIICLVPASRRTDYLPAFDHAADSVRFILLPVAGAFS
ncbi:MAG: hypothetical protein WD492_05570 [Alkalispirochaeta sp.]